MIDRLGNEVPLEALPFAQWIEHHGWHYLHEYVWPWEDDDGQHEGFWVHTIWHEIVNEWPRQNEVWHFTVDVPEDLLQRESAWPHLLKLAEMTSEQNRISCRLPVDGSLYAVGDEIAS